MQLKEDGTFGPPRGISNRADASKAVFGPLFKPIEALFFVLPQTVKHVPNKDRPEFIDNLLLSGPEPVEYASIDYSSYESC